MSRLFRIIKFILKHPLSGKRKFYFLGRFFKWQLSQLIFGSPALVAFGEKSVLLVSRGMTGATGNIYTGLLEFEDMAFVLHFLRAEDTMLDIGANVGVYSILGAVEVGSKVISIEPVPDTFAKLKRNVFLNAAESRVDTVNAGIGGSRSELLFTNSLDTENHVLSAQDATTGLNAIRIEVFPIDELLNNRRPILIKIDVEGYETEVLNGANNLLSSPELKAIIIELNGSGGRYGFSDQDIHKKLLNAGFTPYAYDPFERKLRPLVSFGHFNTIYVRDLSWVQERLKNSRKFLIHGITF